MKRPTLSTIPPRQSTTMNWYFEKEGISQGPLTEALLEERVKKKDGVLAETLIWHPGMEDWEPVAKLRPQWLHTPAPIPAPAPVAPLPPPPPQASAPPLAEAAPQPKKPTSTLKPITANPKPPPAEPAPQEAGFFKKLFGRGKKK